MLLLATILVSFLLSLNIILFFFAKYKAIYFKFTGIDLFSDDSGTLRDEVIPNTKFSNPLKTIYYKYIVRLDPYSIKSVKKLLKKFIKNINIIQGNSNEVLKKIDLNKFDYVFVDGGHKFETVKNDLDNLSYVGISGCATACAD